MASCNPITLSLNDDHSVEKNWNTYMYNCTFFRCMPLLTIYFSPQSTAKSNTLWPSIFMQAITQHNVAIETNAILPSIRSNHFYHCIVTYIKLLKIALSWYCCVSDLFLKNAFGDGFVSKLIQKNKLLHRLNKVNMW